LIKIAPTVALFGGSFDPPHIGHQTIIQKISALEDIDALIVMPAFLNPFKKTTLASAQQRLEWCKEICSSTRVIVSDFEVSQKRSVYTIETLNYLASSYSVKYLVIGSDNLASIDRWRDFTQIDSRVVWIVVTREGDNPSYSKLREYRVIELDMPISSTAIRSGEISGNVDKRIESKVEQLVKHRLKQRTQMTIKERVDAIVSVLDSKKAEQIEVFDLEGSDYIAKEVVIANSFGGKHTIALYEHLKNELKPKGEEFLGSDESDDWVVVDLGDIIVHIMTPAYREKYSMEKFLSELITKQAE